MGSINSRNKGSSFERVVAKRLTEWSGKEFHRTPLSGGLHWENDKRVVSDIVPPQEFSTWPFSIECKKVEYDWDFTYLLKGTSMFWVHWAQADRDAKEEDMTPMLIFSKNRRDIYIGIQTPVFDNLYKGKTKPSHHFIIVNDNKSVEGIAVFKLDDFLETVTLDEVLALQP